VVRPQFGQANAQPGFPGFNNYDRQIRMQPLFLIG
jgi:hypothetical protein